MITEPAMPAEREAFFEQRAAGLVALPDARSPWSADLMHGRLVSALMARELRAQYLDDSWQPTRMTTDLLRPIPMTAPLTFDTVVRRSGSRLLVIEVIALQADTVVATASVQAFRRGDEGQIVNQGPRASFSPPQPNEVQPDPRERPRYLGEVRSIGEHADPAGRFNWFRERAPLVAGERWDPFVRVVAAADWVSPFTSLTPLGLPFINADITLYLNRLPVEDWIGFEIADYRTADGIALSTCIVHDVQGPIGTVACAALAVKSAMQRH